LQEERVKRFILAIIESALSLPVHSRAAQYLAQEQTGKLARLIQDDGAPQHSR
jgi:hypothetical protein